MAILTLKRPHALDAAEAKRRIAVIGTKIAERFGATCTWKDRVLHIDHAEVSGTVTLAPTEVVVVANLGFTLGMFRGRVEAEIARIIDREMAA